MSVTQEKKAELLRRAERAYARAEANGERRLGQILKHAFLQLAEQNNAAFLLALQRMKRLPVTIDEFVDSPEFLGGHMEVWKDLRPDLREMNPDQLAGEPAVSEVILGGATGTGKALALDTPIPTPSGWTTMGALQDGDEVYDETGAICRIVKAHAVLHDRQCYRVVFSDGSSIVADAEHLWRTYTRSERANHSKGRARGKPWAVRTTAEINATLEQRHAIPVAGPLAGTDVTGLGIDPYTLGVWLGDGSSSAGRIWVHDKDRAIVSEVERFYTVTKQTYSDGRLGPHTVHGLQQSLRRLGLLKNKHIPSQLLRASYEQRLALLQGLMDTDGTVDKRTGRVQFTNVNERLARQVAELVRSLGWKARLREFDATLNGAFVSRGWHVEWTPLPEPYVFRLPRKRQYQGIMAGDVSRARWRVIERVEPVPSEPVRCITVDSPSRLYLAGESMVPTHNTALSTVTNAYALYYLTCFDWPQQLFGLSRATPIVFMFASVSSTVTNRVIYKPFRDLFLGMKFTQKYVEYNKQLESSLSLGQNIIVVPALASVQSMVGQAVVSGILDEVNFMARVENSKQIVGAAGAGGVFDQAEIAYRNLSRRRKSRFVTRGPQPGTLCVVSSTRYRGDFLDRRIEEVIKYGEPGTKVFRRKQYEVVPQERFSGERFRLLVGTDRWPTRILSEEDYCARRYPAGAEVEDVPVEYLPEFQKDAENALRDICGIATDAIRPFISQRDKIVDCINAGRAAHLRTVFDRDEVVLSREALPRLPEKFIPQDRDAPHFVHIDLSTTYDRCGVGMVRHDGYVTVRNERLPRFSAVMALGIKPDPMNQVQIAELREWLLRIVQDTGINLVQISYDGFNSKESIQVLRRAGIRATYISVDRTPEPYEVFRQAIYDTRVLLPDNDLLRQELIQLEWFAHKGKVDHPARGAKDVSDAICGALYAATRHPVVRTGVRAYTDDGEPVRTPYTMQRPTAKFRPSAKKRPSPGRERLRDRNLAPGEPLPEDPLPEGGDTPASPAVAAAGAEAL